MLGGELSTCSDAFVEPARRMRPEILNHYFESASTLPGIGPKLEQTLTRLLVGGQAGRQARLIDLLLHMPSSVIDRRDQPGVRYGVPDSIVTLKLTVDRHIPSPPHGRTPYRVECHDETGEIALVFFHARGDYLTKLLPEGEVRFVSGRLEVFHDRPQIVHPDYVVAEKAFSEMPRIEPVYPLTAGLSPKRLQAAMLAALDRVGPLPEWLDGPLAAKYGFPAFLDALKAVHRPEEVSAAEPNSPSWRRLAHDELLASQLALSLVRAKMRKAGGRRHAGDGHLRQALLAALPFSLTESQRQAVDEIAADLEAPSRMLRLLQGDVGAGKTVVALVAMLQAIESGAQGALMAPTEILARQHFATLKDMTATLGIEVEILTGREKGKRRSDILERLAAGRIDLLVGTHALFQTGIEFADLGLAVVDEQHRFGVHQRLALTAKGQNADVLVMTATPIPRTLVLTYFGDMDVSQLTGKPAGRRPIRTSTTSLTRLATVVDRLAHAIGEGAKAYWVCPLVAESELIDIAAAEERHTALKQRFGPAVGLIHGKMTASEKDAAMAAFQTGETRILVATTVIEVGVDVPDATIMVIEHAERFGLAQLHQLRGRVGRGDKPSSCLLLYKEPVGATAEARLKIMTETEDGFRIAEEDLRLRGEGEVLGTRQSGMPGFRVARIEHHGDLLQPARDFARLILETDPDLTGKHGPALRVLLYLFERDEAIRLLRAG